MQQNKKLTMLYYQRYLEDGEGKIKMTTLKPPRLTKEGCFLSLKNGASTKKYRIESLFSVAWASLFISACFLSTVEAAGVPRQAGDEGSVIADLSLAERAQIQEGKQVTHLIETQGSVWPRVIVYQSSVATPEELTGVFFDFSIHKEMFEGITRSEVFQPISPTTNQVDYTMTFPPILGIQLKPENYRVLDTLSQNSPGTSSYTIAWSRVQSDTIIDINGAMTTEPLLLEQGGEPGQKLGSLIRYDNLIIPPRPALARLIVKMAVQRVQDTVRALDKRVETEKVNSPEALASQVANLKAALNPIDQPAH